MPVRRLYTEGLIFGGGGLYIWNSWSVSEYGGLINGGGGLILKGYGIPGQ
jgi:hypothetical protein